MNSATGPHNTVLSQRIVVKKATLYNVKVNIQGHLVQETVNSTVVIKGRWDFMAHWEHGENHAQKHVNLI